MNWARGNVRHGPFSKPHFHLSLDLTRLRDEVLAEPNNDIRAFLTFALGKIGISNSQIFQDAFVLYVFGERKNGYFCDFGATNGISLSNSHALEKHYDWIGICAEPAKSWHDELRSNRPGSIIETDCVWSQTGKTLTFSEARSKELSTITAYTDSDDHAHRRKGAETYEVKTVSLNDMLERHGAPSDLDYLSIDTEGSELDILAAFDFTRHAPKIITVEHNYTENRQKIFDLLTAHGYSRVLAEVSLFDDWYLASGVNLPEPTA